MIAAFAVGAATWSLGEYALHRWVGHNPKSQTEFAKEHRQHHAERLYFATTAKKASYVVPIVGAAFVMASKLAGRTGAAWVGGLAVTYVGYEVLHRRLHTHAPRGPIGRFLRKHHFAHHFNGPQTNHGVTTPVWDLVFRTHRPVDVVRVPEKHAMPWLVDPATGDAKPEFARDYVVHHPAKRRASEAREAGL